MPTLKYFLIVFTCALLCASSTTAAQILQQEAGTARAGSQSVTIIIESRQLRITAPASTQEIRLEVSNQAGEAIYDSGPMRGSELSWALLNSSGDSIASGLYGYTLMIKAPNAETPTAQRGHLIVERGRDYEPQTDRLWVTNQGAVGAEAAISGGELTISAGPETSIAGTRIGKDGASAARPAINFSGFGTTGRIAKFEDRKVLGNSVITEGSKGRIGIGTETPGSALTVAGEIESTSGGIKFPDGTVQTTSAEMALFQVNHDATFAGNGTTASPISIADGGVTRPKIATGQVVKSLNGLSDNVSLTAGANITITPSGNTLNIAASGQFGAVASNGTLVGNGTSAAPLGVAVPLRLSGSSDNGPILNIVNSADSGWGLGVRGGDATSNDVIAGFGVTAIGGNSNNNSAPGGIGVDAHGGAKFGLGFGGIGVNATGGKGYIDLSGFFAGQGGPGVVARGGDSNIGSAGDGLWAFPGVGYGGVEGLAGKFDGLIYISAKGQGIILRSPDGATCRLLSIDNAGTLAFTPTACR